MTNARFHNNCGQYDPDFQAMLDRDGPVRYPSSQMLTPNKCRRWRGHNQPHWNPRGDRWWEGRYLQRSTRP